jgi:hypothetical protein
MKERIIDEGKKNKTKQHREEERKKEAAKKKTRVDSSSSSNLHGQILDSLPGPLHLFLLVKGGLHGLASTQGSGLALKFHSFVSLGSGIHMQTRNCFSWFGRTEKLH